MILWSVLSSSLILCVLLALKTFLNVTELLLAKWLPDRIIHRCQLLSMLWEDIKWNETLLKQGVAFSNRPEIKLCKGTVLRARHVWGKWQKAEVKAKLILQRPEQLHFVLQKHAAVSTGRAWLVSDLQAADSLLHLPDPLRGQCGVWTMQRLSLTTSFLPGEALLPFHQFFF